MLTVAAGGFSDFFARQQNNWPISLEKAARRFTACFKYAVDTAATTRIPESYTLEPTTDRASENYEKSETGNFLCFPGTGLRERCRR